MSAILIVDDSASIRQTVKISLSGLGHVVTEAKDGSEGLSKAKTARFDLVITDLNMPVMDGLSMIKAMRTLPTYAGVPIVFLTTESDAGIKSQAKSAGATGWITKPFDAEQLCRIATKVLAK
ncbi:two-component system chemotaxis response regulator CheY [Rhizomicrobium palustre]|uniref:Two-component system chemotaxis response regulator CheY n=1 Tax=Rhizomicrobium palustre TaxID=189966 RepID=A0A846N1J1_9PROT|nr:response regulator [Rhizomicrobium palustre]NIK89092.1 two-component system chemotaxis response regulator CheY [Rhizomicrobium palustre]